MSTDKKAVNPNEYFVDDWEMAKRLNISRRHIHNLKNQGVLRAVKLGAALRFPVLENMDRVLKGTPASTR